MRKVVLSVNVTLDGYMAGANCELDWHFRSWNAEMAGYACGLLSRADTLLLGRITYLGMANYWPAEPMHSRYSADDIAFASMMNHHTKIVFSRTLNTATWNNSQVVRGNIIAHVKRLKQQPGKDMVIFGSAQLVAALMRHNLIDEYIIWVHPVVLGKGKPLFKTMQTGFMIGLLATKTFSSGVVVLDYKLTHAS